jgi:hypothetical protein
VAKALDPATATLAQVAGARKRQHSAVRLASVAGLAAAGMALWLVNAFDLLGSPLAILILTVAGTGVYRLAYELQPGARS